jgi:adenylate cyclase
VLIQAEAVEAMLRGNAVRPSSAWFAEPAGAIALDTLCALLAVRLRPALRVACSFAPGVGSRRGGSRARALLLVDPTGPFSSPLPLPSHCWRAARDEWRARLLRLSSSSIWLRGATGSQPIHRVAPAWRDGEITALFTDIEGFTSLTERADPTDLVALLDAYFDVATRIVTDHGGMIDKSAMRSAICAPSELEDHASRAVASALALLKASRCEIAARPATAAWRRSGTETPQSTSIAGAVGNWTTRRTAAR